MIDLNWKYDPEQWMTSTLRCIEEYTQKRLTQLSGFQYDELWEIVMEFPGPLLDSRRRTVPFEKTIIHFEIDLVEESFLGMGDNVFKTTDDPGGGGVIPQTGSRCLINFDVGIWASDRSGGVTHRLETRQFLSLIFQTPTALVDFRDSTDGGDGGIEIRSFSGGRFVTDSINDVVCYRTLDTTMEIQVFSRTPMDYSVVVPTILEIDQDPNLSIVE
jgi:hypothetical protein